MGDTWITNMDHFLEIDGSPAMGMPRSAKRFMEYLGSIIEAVTGAKKSGQSENRIETGVLCRRRPNRTKCNGKIVASISRDRQNGIIWECPICKDNGVICTWEESMWDRTKNK